MRENNTLFSETSNDTEATDVSYNFPKLVLTDDRQGFVASLMPEIENNNYFDPEEAFKALVSALKKNREGKKLIAYIDSLGKEKNVYDLRAFKNVVLKWGYSTEMNTEKKCQAVEILDEILYVRTKEETIEALEVVREIQILSTLNPFDLWACLLCTGFLRKLKHRDILLHICSEEHDDIYDFPDIIDKVLENIDWEEHTYDIDDPNIPDQNEPDADSNLDGKKKKTQKVTPFTAEDDYICPICLGSIGYKMGPRHMFICSCCNKACHYQCTGEWVMASMSIRDYSWKCPTCNTPHRF